MWFERGKHAGSAGSAGPKFREHLDCHRGRCACLLRRRQRFPGGYQGGELGP